MSRVPGKLARERAEKAAAERPRLSIELCLDNAAFDDAAGPGELARIFRELAKRIALCLDLGQSLDDLDGLALVDINGNTVGRLTVAEVAP